MATIITRETGATAKGSPLTNAEVDANFINLNTEVTPSRPTIRPSLNLDFANSKSVDSRITFTRASAATYYDDKSVLQLVRDNKPRIDFDPNTGECKGLLIEEQRTNLLLQSEDFATTWTKGNASVIVNTIVAPSGQLTGDKLVEDTVNTAHLVFLSSASVAPSAVSTTSVYAKAGERTNLLVRVTDNASTGNYIYANFNLSTGAISTAGNVGNATGASASITAVGNGWYRCILSGIPSTSGTATRSQFYLASITGNSSIYTGDGYSGLYIWGAQLEAGAFATSYIPSTTTFTSRASSATYFDSTGVLRLAGTNQPRYGYGYDSASGKWVSQGLVLESAATNLFSNSVMTIFSAGQQMNIVPTSVAGIDGKTGEVYKLVPTATSSSTHSIYKNLAGTSPSTRCMSVYFKAAGYNFVRIYADGINPMVGGVVYDLSSGTASINSAYSGANRVGYGMENVGNGWYRCWVSGTSTNADWYFHIDVAPDATFSVFAGDENSGVYAWGPQEEYSSVPTSYIPTYGASATRAADVSSSAATTRVADLVYMQGENFSSWYKQEFGTAYADWTSIGGTMPAFSFQKSSSSTSNHWTLSATSGTYSYFSSYNGGSNGSLNGPASGVLAYTNHRIAVAAQASNFAISLDGSSAAPVSGGSYVPQVDRVVLTGTYNLASTNAWLKKFSYYPKRLSNTELQALTK